MNNVKHDGMSLGPGFGAKLKLMFFVKLLQSLERNDCKLTEVIKRKEEKHLRFNIFPGNQYYL